MSSASNTLYIEPTFNSNKFRSEFRIPESNGVYRSDMRLTGVGFIKNDAGNDKYNLLTGAYGVISSIEIQSGAQTLDQVRNFSQYVAFKNLLHSNNEQTGVFRFLSKSGLGYVADGDVSFEADGDPIVDGTNGTKITNQVPTYGNTLFGSDAAARDKNTNFAWLDLRECLGFLRESPYVPTNVYPDLRIVVNYESVAQLQNVVQTANINTSTEKPLLIVEYEPDVNVAMALMNQYEGVSFNSVEHDSVILNASGVAQNTTANQEESYLLKGFNDKFVEKVVIVNTPLDQASWRTGNNNIPSSNLGSVAQLDWAIQLRVNGQELFPSPSGYLMGKNRRLGKLVDSWGSTNIAPFQNMCGNSGGPDKIYAVDMRGTEGQMDYTGFRLDDVIREMKLTTSRTAVGGGDADPATNPGLRQSLRLNIYAISRKNITPLSNGQILIRYV
jgi:hypothetical protein